MMMTGSLDNLRYLLGRSREDDDVGAQPAGPLSSQPGLYL
jgi:hypothetical protein